MEIFDGVIFLMDQFSNQETQKEIGEKVFEYVNDFYEVSAKVIEFGVSKVEEVKKSMMKWNEWNIEILSPKWKAKRGYTPRLAKKSMGRLSNGL
jgi:hypothetical protein